MCVALWRVRDSKKVFIIGLIENYDFSLSIKQKNLPDHLARIIILMLFITIMY